MNGDEEAYEFLKKVANAVILRAIKDLDYEEDTYRFRTARNFCLGVNEIWLDSLRLWCELAGVDEGKVKEYARERINGTFKRRKLQHKNY